MDLLISAFICDLDGTLYDCEERRKRCFTPEKKDFDRWNREAVNDGPNVWCAEIVQAMRFTGFRPIFVTGRESTYGADTVRWFKRHLNMAMGDYELFMRPKGDYRKDSELKEEIYVTKIRDKYSVLFAIDDRQQVVDIWRSHGIVCLQCAKGDF